MTFLVAKMFGLSFLIFLTTILNFVGLFLVFSVAVHCWFNAWVCCILCANTRHLTNAGSMLTHSLLTVRSW